MASRRAAKSLVTLSDQVDALAPNRDKSSDGTLPSDAHHEANPTSDHEADANGVGHALDITHDPAHGVDTYKLAEWMRTKRDPRIKYVISNRRIMGDPGYGQRNNGRSAWTWYPYNGDNPHTEHMHVSVNAASALADDVKPWEIALSAPVPGGEPKPPLLLLGSTGDAVKEAQKLLAIPVMGTFDAAMDAAVRAYQRGHALNVDGKIGVYTWRKLEAEPVTAPPANPPPVTPQPPSSTLLPQAKVDAIVKLAAASDLARYSWKDRGRAPAGYIKGMAVTFALVLLKLQAGDSAARVMAAAVHESAASDQVDALSWYNSNFRNAGMSNDVAGVDTLRHLFVLLIGLGMRESNGHYFEGRDLSAGNTSADEAEAGLFQTSWNIRSASPELPKLFAAYKAFRPDGFLPIFKEGCPPPTAASRVTYGSGDGAFFQELSKSCPAFAVEIAAVGLRTRGGKKPFGHWGPIREKDAELRPEADKLLQQVQAIVDGTSVSPAPNPAPAPAPVPSIGNPLAGKRLRYLLEVANPDGKDGEITEGSYDSSRPAPHGIAVAYINPRDEKNTGQFGPYLPKDDIDEQYSEPAPKADGPGFDRNLLPQLDRAVARGFNYVEFDNLDTWNVAVALRCFNEAKQRRLGVLVKNPGLVDGDDVALLRHSAVFGVIVEKGAGSPSEMHALRVKAGKNDLPVWFVAFGAGKTWAQQTAQQIASGRFLNMYVTYSSKGEYGSSEDVSP